MGLGRTIFVLTILLAASPAKAAPWSERGLSAAWTLPAGAYGEWNRPSIGGVAWWAHRGDAGARSGIRLEAGFATHQVRAVSPAPDTIVSGRDTTVVPGDARNHILWFSVGLQGWQHAVGSTIYGYLSTGLAFVTRESQALGAAATFEAHGTQVVGSALMFSGGVGYRRALGSILTLHLDTSGFVAPGAAYDTRPPGPLPSNRTDVADTPWFGSVGLGVSW